MNLREVFVQKKFIVTIELSPPKGINTTNMLKYAKLVSGRVDGINVTDNQRAVMRLSSLASCHLLKENGFNPILQMTCRDRNRLALQSDLLSASVLGIENICIMTGDHPSKGDHPSAKPVFDLDSVQLLEIIRKMKEGYDFSGNQLDTPIDFFVGAVVNPNLEPLDLQLIKMEKKIIAGAEFFQTQPLFDIDHVENFIKAISHFGIPALIGITPLRSAKMAHFMNNHLLNVPIPENILKRIENADSPIHEGIKIAAELIRNIKKNINGIHIMPIGMEEHIITLLNEAGI